MKRLIGVFVLLCVLSFSFLVMSETTGSANWDSEVHPAVNDYLNSSGLLNHTHEYNELDDPLGLGVDIKVVEFKNKWVDSVNIEIKRDLKNELTSGYLMVHLNVSSLFKK